MAGYWPFIAGDLSMSREDIAFADMMNSYPKLVFSKTISSTHWKNSRIMKGSMKSEIIKLKQRQGKDMIIYGSGKLVSSMMRENLVDEYRLWIHPVILGNGKPFYADIKDSLNLQLIEERIFSSGVVGLRYDRIY
jgi:dihydrofolate reductase